MAPEQQTQQTQQLRNFKGCNLTDTRTSIDDEEWSFLENAIPIGKGNLKLVPGSGTVLATVSSGIVSLWGFVLTNNATGDTSSVLLSVNSDGSMNQIQIPTGANTIATNTVIAGAGTVDTTARLTPFKASSALIISPTKGYFAWNGLTFGVVSTTVFGTDIATFEGRVWIAQATAGHPSRTLSFTAPDTFNDFNATHGAGTTTITDSAFLGNITRILSALEQLWVVGSSAVESISNVQTAGGVTTFSTTNIVANVGSVFPGSVSPFFRTFVMVAPYGVYAIVGATPQKLSDKLDGLFPDLHLDEEAELTSGHHVVAAVTAVHGVFVWVCLVPYHDPSTSPFTHRDILLCFAQGKWFFASSGLTLEALASVPVGGNPNLYVTNGTALWQLFADETEPVTYKIQSKLFDFGDGTMMKEFLRFGLELQSDNVVAPLVTIENEEPGDAANLALTTQNTIIFTGLGGVVITFVGVGPITWVTTGLQLARNATGVQMLGNYLGFTLQGTEAVWTLSAAQMEIKPAGKWVSLGAGI